MGNSITDEEKGKLKLRGFLCQKDGRFSCRVVTGDGSVTAEECLKLSMITEKYGTGSMNLTARTCVELPGIPYENIEDVVRELGASGLKTGGTGPKVRPVTSCKGGVCSNGLYDTQAVAREIHKRFYEGWRDVKLPHKFKIGVGGCPNNCVKPSLNDFGLIGQAVPEIDTEKCRTCKTCTAEKKCSVGAIRKESGNTVIDRDKCLNCGLCAKYCPFGAIKIAHTGVKVYIGGRWGREYHIGQPLDGIYTTEQALDLIEAALEFYRDNGNPHERFGVMTERLGFDNVKAAILKKI